jgi:hypothetical protein
MGFEMLARSVAQKSAALVELNKAASSERLRQMGSQEFEHVGSELRAVNDYTLAVTDAGTELLEAAANVQ